MKYVIEKEVGQVKLNNYNILLEDVEDMEYVEYWEDRLDLLEEDYVVAFREIDNKIYYSIFCNTRKKGSLFK